MDIEYKNNPKAIIEALKKVQLFKDVADDEKSIEKIANICKYKKISKSTPIIRVGEKGGDLFIMLKGDVSVVNRTLQNEEYTVVTLKSEWGGIAFGEIGLLNADRTASVITETDCELLVISPKDFEELGDKNPSLGLKITRRIALKLAQDLNKANKDVITLFSALVDEISDE